MTYFPRTMTYTMERVFSAPPTLVYRAWSDPEAKAQWFGALRGVDADMKAEDFRVGGRERFISRSKAGTATYDIFYRAIIPDQSIVFECESREPDGHAARSLISVEFHPEGGGTRLVLKEKLLRLMAQSTQPLKAAAGFY
ncbi:SRPBCC domain-containing protein [Kordiimonas sp.]|uniref:SRPBCC domain-containing protein n=1 Tax=Kordiimonas sp. TaxID=1970157 RepID=UPI003A939982